MVSWEFVENRLLLSLLFTGNSSDFYLKFVEKKLPGNCLPKAAATISYLKDGFFPAIRY